jgi:uncharacterized membrane protein
MTKSYLAREGCLIAFVAVVMVVLAAVWNPFGMSVLGLIPASLAIFSGDMRAAQAATRRTPAARDLWSRVGGFYRILSSDSAQARFDFAARADLYTAYLPWAVAFGCADEWAAKYRMTMAAEPPAPDYIMSTTPFAGGSALAVASMVDSFQSSVNSAISAYQATQSSSSGGGSSGGGGGGGSSGGGGGGGGGGGSW